MRPKQSAIYPTIKVGIRFMLKLTKKADYGLMAMKHLAERAPKGSCSAKDVAEAYGIPSALARSCNAWRKQVCCGRSMALTADTRWRVRTRFRLLNDQARRAVVWPSCDRPECDQAVAGDRETPRGEYGESAEESRRTCVKSRSPKH
jgi:hypothetical protein